MRKLYNHNKGKIHPSPPPPPTPPSTTTTDHLSLLPLAVATLAAALAPEDQEVLAYLLSCTTTTDKKLYDHNTKTGTHAPKFNCYCFSCYTSYWARWDASPRRHLIHEVIDTYEDKYAITNNNNNNSKRNGKNKNKKKNNKVTPSSSSPHVPETASHVPQLVEETRINNSDCVEDEDGLVVGTSSGEKGSIKKIVSFIGERIWGVWGI